MALAHAFDHIVHQLGGQGDIAAAELPLQLGPALHDVLIPLFLLKPGTDLIAGLTGAHQGEPVPVRAAARLFGGEDLNDLTGFDLVIQGDNALIHLGADHPVAHLAVDGIGKVDDSGAQGQVDHVPFGGEDEDLLGDQVALNGVDQVCDVLALRLVLQHLANPGQTVIQGGVVCIPGRHAQLIFPMGRDAVLCRVVHLPGADLHLEGHAGLCDDGGVQRLVHVGLGHGDVVLKPARQGLEHIVDNAQHIVAVLNGIHDDPHGKYIVDFLKGLSLDKHFAVDAVNALDPALDVHIGNGDLHPAADQSLCILDKLLPAFAAGGQVLLDLPVGLGVQVL